MILTEQDISRQLAATMVKLNPALVERIERRKVISVQSRLVKTTTERRDSQTQMIKDSDNRTSSPNREAKNSVFVRRVK